MIGKLRGQLDSSGPDHLLLDVGGVGYQVFASARTLATLPAAGGGLTLHIETHVREDRIQLFGFPDAAERRWFRLLTGVQGVGNRVALAILGVMGPADLVQALAARDRQAFSRADGVGARLAERLVTELRDKAGTMPAGSDSPPAAAATPAAGADAVSALVNLGFSRSAAHAAVARVLAGRPEDSGPERLIPAALRELGA